MLGRSLDTEHLERHHSGTMRDYDHLASMPSMRLLASSAADNRMPNYNFEDSVMFSPQDDFIEGTPDDVTVESNPFRRYQQLPPSVMFQLHMHNILSSHRQVDLSLFKEINDCVQYHADTHKVDFANCKMYSCEELIRAVTEIYNLHGMKPTMNRVKLSDESIAVVPTFDVKTMLLSVLNDPTRTKKENIAPNYDIFTGKPIEPSDNLDEIHTGWAWEQARQFYCGNDPDVMPLGLICFYDKTHSDLYGSLACAPFMCIPHFFKEECRMNTDFHTVLGYIPNLGHGKGKSNRQDSRSKLQDEHNCLKLITDQIRKLNEDGGFVTNIMGKQTKVFVWIHFIAGDTSGHNNLCGKFNCNGETAMPYRCCWCPFAAMADPHPACRLMTLADV